MKRVLASILLGLLIGQQALAGDWFVGPVALGDCTTDATHNCLPVTIQSKAVLPGDNIWVADGTYQGASLMFGATPWNGTAGNSILIRATHMPDATGFYVKVDGQDARNPVRISGNYVEYRGIEAYSSDTAHGGSVCGFTNTSNHDSGFRFMGCNSAGIANNGPAYRIQGDNNYLIDSVSWGPQRKTVEVFAAGSTTNTVRRLITFVDGSIITGGPQGAGVVYHADSTIFENNIILIRGASQPQTAREMDLTGPCVKCTNGTKGNSVVPGAPTYPGCSLTPTCTDYNDLTNYEYPDANYGIGQESTDGQSGGKTLGNFVIFMAGGHSLGFDAGYTFGGFDTHELRDNFTINACTDGCLVAGFQLTACTVAGCLNPSLNTLINNTTIGQTRADTIPTGATGYTVTNYKTFTQAQANSQNFFTGAHATVGALACFAYVDGTITADGLWNDYDSMIPAMKAAMVQHGLPGDDPESLIFLGIGQPPGSCDGPIPTPTNTPTFTSTRTPTWTPSASPTNTPTNTRTPTLTPGGPTAVPTVTPVFRYVEVLMPDGTTILVPYTVATPVQKPVWTEPTPQP